MLLGGPPEGQQPLADLSRLLVRRCERTIRLHQPIALSPSSLSLSLSSPPRAILSSALAPVCLQSHLSPTLAPLISSRSHPTPPIPSTPHPTPYPSPFSSQLLSSHPIHAPPHPLPFYLSPPSLPMQARSEGRGDGGVDRHHQPARAASAHRVPPHGRRARVLPAQGAAASFSPHRHFASSLLALASATSSPPSLPSPPGLCHLVTSLPPHPLASATSSPTLHPSTSTTSSTSYLSPNLSPLAHLS